MRHYGGQLVGLEAQQEVTLEVSLKDGLERVWKSRTPYRASVQGCIDLAASHPIKAAWDRLGCLRTVLVNDARRKARLSLEFRSRHC